MNDPPSCRLCGADPSRQTVRSEHVFGGREGQRFWQCDRCGVVYLHPPLTPEEEAEFYRKKFEPFMADRTPDGDLWLEPEEHRKKRTEDIRRRWKFVKPHLTPDARVLEVGCSDGFMLDEFREQGCEVLGVEPSERSREFLTQRGYTVFDSLEALHDHPQGADGFDLITHFFLFEHIRDPRTFMRQTLDLLRSDGAIVAEIPCVLDPLTELYEIPAFERFYWSVAHHYYYGPRSLGFLLDQIDCRYDLIPEQRYDLSNHITWFMDGEPGGQGRFSHVFSDELVELYKEDLKAHWLCDTLFAVVRHGG